MSKWILFFGHHFSSMILYWRMFGIWFPPGECLCDNIQILDIQMDPLCWTSFFICDFLLEDPWHLISSLRWKISRWRCDLMDVTYVKENAHFTNCVRYLPSLFLFFWIFAFPIIMGNQYQLTCTCLWVI